MSDVFPALFVVSVAVLIWALRKRSKREAKWQAWLDESISCGYLGCEKLQQRREMVRVFQSGVEKPPTWMCQRCYRAFGKTLPADVPK